MTNKADERWHTACHCYLQTEKGGHPMKIDFSFLPGFCLIGTGLLARVAVQGVEQAVVTTAIEYGSAAVVCISTRARATFTKRVTCNAILER